MHQFKVNAKAAFDGDVWQWHQDYGTWKRDDEMPEPRAMNIAVFLDDVTAAQPILRVSAARSVPKPSRSMTARRLISRCAATWAA